MAREMPPEAPFAEAARDSVRFILGGELRVLRDVPPTRTVLEYLRNDERRTGTKEGCAEGDCGACTVVLGTLEGTRVRYRAVNSCIQFLPTLDGQELITVEDLQCPDGRLHPAQQALVDMHGSQCGFCTPGFVMSLFALLHNHPPEALADVPPAASARHGTGTQTRSAASVAQAPSRATIQSALAGNLCRCTGYGPIVDAAQRMYAFGSAIPQGWEQRSANKLRALHQAKAKGALALRCGSQRYFAPVSMDSLARLCAFYPQAHLLSGGTDVGLWVTKQRRRLETLIYTGAVPALQHIREENGVLEIGAAVSYTDALRSLSERYGKDLELLLERLGSVQIRNLGTIGGNIANGSPIGDSPPPLIALGASVVLCRFPEPGTARQGGKRSAASQADAPTLLRREILLENYFLDYGKQDRHPGEFVVAVRLPAPPKDLRFHCYKVAKRWDQDITAVLGAFALILKHGRIVEARVAYGGMAATPKRAHACEAALRERSWNPGTLAEAQQALQNDFQPITDMRASAAYRMRVAQNLLQRCFLETTQTAPRTRIYEELPTP